MQKLVIFPAVAFQRKKVVLTAALCSDILAFLNPTSSGKLYVFNLNLIEKKSRKN